MKVDTREIARVLSISEEEVIREGVEALLREKLREHRVELTLIVHKYGVKTLEEMDQLIKSGKVKEEEILPDLQRADHLTYLIKEIEDRLVRLSA